MTSITEFRQCRCGYSIMVYPVKRADGELHFHFFDGHSGNYEQLAECPGCQDRLDYITLEG